MDEFEYQPLQANKIRLLRILLGPEETIVSCHIEHHHIDNLPKYAALSYTWGTDSTRFPILIDGRALQVTPNLHTALQEFRARPVRHYNDDVIARFHQIAKEIAPMLLFLQSSNTASEEQRRVALVNEPLLLAQMKIGEAKSDIIMSLRTSKSSMSEGRKHDLLLFLAGLGSQSVSWSPEKPRTTRIIYD